MNKEWRDEERMPIRGVQIYDRASQASFKKMSIKQRLQWLQEINELYWAARTSQSLFKAAEPRKPWPEK